MAKSEPAKKEGSKSAGVKSDSSLKKAIAAYRKKKKSMSSEQRKKVEARLKSSQQRLGRKVGMSNESVDMAQPASMGHVGKTRSQPRAFGGKFGVKAGSGPKGSTGTATAGEDTEEAEPVTPAQINQSVSALAIGQTVSLPGGNAKIKRLSNGYQVVKMDGSYNKVHQTKSQATMAGNRLIGGRAPKDVTAPKKASSTVPGGKAGA